MMIRYFIAMLLFSAIISVSGQQKSQRGRLLPPSTPSFELNVNKLPPKYSGQNIVSLYKALAGSLPEQGEFETTESHLKRLMEVNTNKLYAFTEDLEESLTCDSSYNPDNQLWEIQCNYPRHITLNYTSKYLGMYKAKNAYNASVNVKRYSSWSYGIVNHAENRDDLTFTIPMSLNQAKAFKDRFRIVYICNLHAPQNEKRYTYFEKEYNTPTFHEPEEWFHTYYNLNVKLVDLWIIDKNTGEVLKKYRLEDDRRKRALLAAQETENTVEKELKSLDIERDALTKSRSLSYSKREIEPNYPPLAKAAQVFGVVEVEVGIDESGNVTTAKALSGHPLLKDAAVAAARGWKFIPEFDNDVPRKTVKILPFSFMRSGDCQPVPLTHPKWESTAEAVKNRTSGVISLQALIGADGQVKNVIVLNGLPDGLTENAVKGVYGMKFKPGSISGVPSDCWKKLEVTFTAR